MILAIDPGTEQSAWVEYDDCGDISAMGIEPNAVVAWKVAMFCEEFRDTHPGDEVVVEMIASYGMPVGRSTFETVCWIGRFAQSAAHSGVEARRIYRADIKMHLCKDSRAKDANIRQALIDRFEPTGGGKTPQVGTKKDPGPLYGVKKDLWAALAVAVTSSDKPELMEAFP